VIHSFQTNGTLLKDAWCDFFKAHNVEVGLSLDGPQEIHDFHRKTRKGHGTYEKAMRGLEVMQRNEMPFGVISVISDISVDQPDELYEFYRSNGITGIGLNIEEVEGANANSSLGEGQAGLDRIHRFLSRLYQLNTADGFPLSIREFEIARRNILEPGWSHRPDGSYFNLEVDPLGMLNVDCFGNFSSFSPELLGQPTEKYGSFSFGSLINGSVFDATQNDAFVKVLADIEAGNRKCAETCEYYAHCGGASPSNKYYENGSFDSTETHQCRSTVQMPLQIVMADLENDLGITDLVPVVDPESEDIFPDENLKKVS
ncbi:MAG: cyclophane-forming radical SAM/SPASM peptide maturase GrrM/OscB, partial [Verrucomicrobiota bacterium]